MNVTVRCLCPPRDGQPRHDSDTVVLRDTLDFRSAVAIRNAAMVARVEDEGIGTGEILAVLTEGYILHGVEGWTVVDEKGKPRPVTKQAIRDVLLTDLDAAIVVADAADALYGEKVVLPLLLRASTSSPLTPTDVPTSRMNGSRSKPRTRRSPSSTTTIPTGGTEATGTSPAGVYSS